MSATVRKIQMKILLVFLIILGLSLTSISENYIYAEINQPIATLVFRTNGGGVRPDYGLFIAQYLRDIGIEVEVKVEEWAVIPGIIYYHDHDIGVTGLSGGGMTPDMRDLYTEDGSLNFFLLDKDIPYGNQSEQMQNLGVTITNLAERQQLYYDWQQLMMDKIIPMLPLFSPNIYTCTWSNTHGYVERWGLVDSLPYMYFDGYHEGQETLDEFILADANWRELNPLFTDDTSSSLIWQLLSEQLIHYSPDFYPMNTGLIQAWTQIDDFHYKFYLRDGVFWNPSYNITERTKDSIPLDEIPESELMLGLKNNEFSNGTNQQVTAKDAVFTLLSWSNPITSESTVTYNWISDCYVDPVNPLAFHICIDGNPDTPQPDHYVDFWCRMTNELLPEFFLNSSSIEKSYSDGGVECTGLYPEIECTPQWVVYSTSAFGCGKYMLDYYVRNSVTVLTRSPYWCGVGAIDGQEGLEPFVEKIKVKVIPDTSAELAEFKAGKLDITYLTYFPQERKNMETDSRFTVYHRLSASLTFMYFNLKRPFIGGAYNYQNITTEGKEEYNRGVGIRKAICYAINRQEMNDILHDGEYVIAHSVLYPCSSFYYYEDIIKYDYDLILAEEWLRDSFGLVDFTINILNSDEKGLDILIIFSFQDPQQVSEAVIFYNINDEGYNSTTMLKQTTTSYYINLGSSFTNGTIVEYYVKYTCAYGDIRKTLTYTLELYYYDEIADDSFITLDATSWFVIGISLGILSLSFLINKKMQKVKEKKF